RLGGFVSCSGFDPGNTGKGGMFSSADLEATLLPSVESSCIEVRNSFKMLSLHLSGYEEVTGCRNVESMHQHDRSRLLLLFFADRLGSIPPSAESGEIFRFFFLRELLFHY